METKDNLDVIKETNANSSIQKCATIPYIKTHATTQTANSDMCGAHGKKNQVM